MGNLVRLCFKIKGKRKTGDIGRVCVARVRPLVQSLGQ